MAKKKAKKKAKKRSPVGIWSYTAVDNAFDQDPYFEGHEEAVSEAASNYANAVDKHLFNGELPFDTRMELEQVAKEVIDLHVGNPDTKSAVVGLTALAERIKADPKVLEDRWALSDIAEEAIAEHEGKPKKTAKKKAKKKARKKARNPGPSRGATAAPPTSAPETTRKLKSKLLR